MVKMGAQLSPDFNKSICDIATKRWLSDREARIYTTLGKDTLLQARDTKQLPYRKMGSRVIYERIHLDQWMEKYAKRQ